MRARIGIAVAGLTAILGSATAVAQAAAGAQAAPVALSLAVPRAASLAAPWLTLSASSVSASRTIGAEAGALRPNTTYELISSKTRTDSTSTTVSGSSDTATVLTQVKTGKKGHFSTRFVVPLSWRQEHLIEVRKVKGADLVGQTPDWLTVTPPRPSLGLATDTVHAGAPVRGVVSGVRADTKYEVFNRTTRSTECDCGGDTTPDGPAWSSFRTDANGRAVLKFAAPDQGGAEYLIEFRKTKGQQVVGGANAWLTVVR